MRFGEGEGEKEASLQGLVRRMEGLPLQELQTAEVGGAEGLSSDG